VSASDEDHNPPSDLLGSDKESDSVNESNESDFEESIFDQIDQAYDFNANNIIEIRDSLFAPKNNIV
jgi:hypothetical protein